MGLHGILAAALGTGAQVGGVAEHLAQGNQSVDLLCAGPGLHALDLTTAGVQVADDVAHIVPVSYTHLLTKAMSVSLMDKT